GVGPDGIERIRRRPCVERRAGRPGVFHRRSELERLVVRGDRLLVRLGQEEQVAFEVARPRAERDGLRGVFRDGADDAERALDLPGAHSLEVRVEKTCLVLFVAEAVTVGLGDLEEREAEVEGAVRPLAYAR